MQAAALGSLQQLPWRDFFGELQTEAVCWLASLSRMHSPEPPGLFMLSALQNRISLSLHPARLFDSTVAMQALEAFHRFHRH